jgi:formate dehydrogenase accessory protein FdhD
MSPRRDRSSQGPDYRDLAEMTRAEWSEGMSLGDAAASARRLARYEPGVVAELPAESILRIDVNGDLAGAVRCLPDAPAELALGWAFMHRFFDAPDPIDSVTIHAGRVSLMIQSAHDPQRRRVQAAGWVEETPLRLSQPADRPEPFVIHADVLMAIVREAVGLMSRDGARDGFVHAAIASDTAVLCIARDREAESAVAKVLGWRLRDGRGADAPFLIVRGIVERLVVEAAYRLGIDLIVTTGIPTADAFREATGREISILGLATSARPGLLVDAGHVVEDSDLVPDSEDGMSAPKSRDKMV